jgi:deoxyguanosine kinase
MYIISVEGNIGSGKSTLIKNMKENLTEIDNVPVVYLPEPVHLWESIKSEDGKNMIEKFYENQEKYSFSFQMMAYISRLQIFKEAIIANPNSIIITERCLLTDYNIFAKMLYESNKMLKEEYEIYKKWFNYFNEIEINQFIYIKTDPEISCNRCVKRNRSGENNISLEYLQKCSQMHEEWFEQQKNNSNVYVIDGNKHMPIYNDNLMINPYDFEIIKIKNMIQQNLKSKRLENIMLCMKNILMEDINKPNDSNENSILTDEDQEDELSNAKSDDSSYQLSEKESDISCEESQPVHPIQPPKKLITIGFEVSIGLFEIVVISSLIGLFYLN